MKEIKKKKKIVDCLQMSHSSWQNLCNDLAGIMSDMDTNKESLFQWILVNYERYLSDTQIPVTEEQDNETWKTLLNKYSDLIKGLLHALLIDNLPEDVFYQAVWDRIQKEDLLAEKDGLSVLLYVLMTSLYIPYFQLPEGIKMEDSEYRGLSEKHSQEIRRILFALVAPLAQKTERASILLNLLQNCADEKERAVMMSFIIHYSMRLARQKVTELYD